MFSIFFVLFFFVFGEEIPVEDSVYVLTDATFHEFIGREQFVLVEFYAPWCGHCKQLQPEYARAAEKLKEDSNVKLAKVDATQNSEVAGQFEIAGYPTLKLFTNGVPRDYDGPRHAEGIVSWLITKTEPPVVITSVEQLEEIKTTKPVVVVGIFKEATSPEAKVLQKVFKEVEFRCATTTDEAVALSLLGASVEVASLVVLKNFDEGKNVYEDVWEEDKLKSFISSRGRRLLIPLTMETQQQVFANDNMKIAFVFLNPTQESQDLEKCISDVALKVRGELVFTTVDTTDEIVTNVLNYFGVSKNEHAILHCFDRTKNGKYEHPGDLTCDSVGEFVDNFLSGKIAQKLKSEEQPANWNDAAVKILTGNTFNSLALDTNKHVFVKFYAPWCGHCKSLAPVWEKLAELFNNVDDVLIAKIDSTANDAPDLEIKSFPTLKLFLKDTNEIIDYDGQRDVKSFVEFLHAHTGHTEIVASVEEVHIMEEEEEEEEGETPDREEF